MTAYWCSLTAIKQYDDTRRPTQHDAWSPSAYSRADVTFCASAAEVRTMQVASVNWRGTWRAYEFRVEGGFNDELSTCRETSSQVSSTLCPETGHVTLAIPCSLNLSCFKRISCRAV